MANTYKALPVFPSLTQVGPNTMTSSFNLANTVGAAGLALNDIIQFIAIPPGALVTRIIFDLCQLDSNVAPTVTLDIGTDLTAAQGGVDVAGFFSQSTAGRSANYNVISQEGDSSYVHLSLPFNFNQESQFIGILLKNATLQMKVHAAPATATTAGVIACTCEYTMTQNSNMQ